MNICYDYLRPKKAALLRERYKLYEDSARTPKCVCAHNAVVYPCLNIGGGDLYGCIIDSNGNLIEAPYIDTANRELFEEWSRQHPAGESFDGSVIYLGTLNTHWGHFITDCLSTFWWLGEMDADKYLFSVPEGKDPHLYPNIIEALDLLGVRSKVEFISSPVKCRKVIIPCRGMLPRDYILPECKRIYERIAAEACRNMDKKAAFPEKILISRSSLKKAVLNDIGTAEVEKIFTDNGYTAVYPEKISLTQFIRLLHHARETVMISGTLPHNMLFAPCGSKMIVLEKYANINNFQQGIDLIKDFDVVYIDAAYLIKCVSPGLGPFILGNTDEFRRYCRDAALVNDMKPMNCRKVLAQYLKLHFRHYKWQWILPEWLEPEIGLLREAYNATLPIFEDWLTGKKWIYLYDLLRPRFIARKLRHLLHHLR